MLSPFLGDERKQRIEEVVAHRTYSICIAVEGLLDLGNISAVCRSADALGFQSVHVISNGTKKK
jgi:tRNA G18 (ribose-2'-O)-methylase SpoU